MTVHRRVKQGVAGGISVAALMAILPLYHEITSLIDERIDAKMAVLVAKSQGTDPRIDHILDRLDSVDDTTRSITARIDGLTDRATKTERKAAVNEEKIEDLDRRKKDKR